MKHSHKHKYNPSLKDIMDKYYEMFRGRNHTTKKEEWVVWERETSLSFIKITQSLIY